MFPSPIMTVVRLHSLSQFPNCSNTSKSVLYLHYAIPHPVLLDRVRCIVLYEFVAILFRLWLFDPVCSTLRLLQAPQGYYLPRGCESWQVESVAVEKVDA